MATQFSELQKLLINVADSKCDAFIKTHVNAAWDGTASELPEFDIEAGIDDVYFNKVVFLQKYKTIYTKGTFFGNTWDLIEDLKNGISANGITVKYNPDATDGPAIETTVVAATYDKDSDSWDKPSNVVTGSTVKEYVDAKVAGAVAEAAAAMNYCGQITEANFNDKKSKASNGDVYVVSGNFTIGTGDDAEKVEDGDLVIFAKDGDNDATYTVVERNLDGAIIKDGDLTASKIVVASGTDKVKTTNYGIGSDETTYTAFGSTYTLATEVATAAYIAYKIGQIDTAYTTVTYSGDYVNVSYALTTGGTTNDYTYTVSVVTKTLGDAVGMTLGADGKWYAPDGITIVEDGLATAADVANELVSDEKVIAAALNDHEGRLDILEAFAKDVDENQLVIGEVTVTGLTAEATTQGLVNAELLANVINALDPWEEYGE